MNSNAIVQIGTIIIALVGAIITYIVVPYIKANTTEKQRENVKFWVKVAVSAAEQIFKGTGLGENKKQYVIDFLNSKGIDITEDQLDILIEATVHELNNGYLSIG